MVFAIVLLASIAAIYVVERIVVRSLMRTQEQCSSGGTLALRRSPNDVNMAFLILF